MASQDRIDQLEVFAAGWTELHSKSKQQYDRLMDLLKKLDHSRDKEMIELLNRQIAQESNALNEYERALIHMGSIVALAKSGKDV